MNTLVLIAALVGAVDYSAGRSDIVASIDYGAGRQAFQEFKPPPVEEEEPNATVEDPLRVILYVDLSDVAALRKLLSECDRLPGLKVEYRDKDQVPEPGKRFGLPLAHYHAESGWKFVRWVGADSFRRSWLAGNPDQNAKQQSRIQAARTNPDSHYRAHSYEWHLTQGESAAALRSHLASPRAEHHGIAAPRDFLAGLSFTELVGLHSDFHNGRPDWSQINRQAASQSRNQVATVMPFRFEYRRRSAGSCPNGRCPR